MDNYFNLYNDISSISLIASKMDTEPKLTIAIPTFQRPHLLKEAIKSALSQKTSIPYEIIIVDNTESSTIIEKNIKVIQSFKSPILSLYKNETNLGMFGNWNRCIELAKGQYVTILNDDDLLEPHFIQAIFDLSIQMKSPSMLYSCTTQVIDERKEKPKYSILRFVGKKIKALLSNFIVKPYELLPIDYFLANPHMGSLGILFDRQKAIEIGGINPAMYPSADYDFFSRYAIHYGSVAIPKKYAFYRIRENESQSENVIQGWVKQSLEIHRDIQTSLPYFHGLLELYAQMHTIDLAYACQQTWNKSIDVKAILKSNGLPSSPKYIHMLFLRYLIKILYKIRSFDRSKNRRSNLEKYLND